MNLNKITVIVAAFLALVIVLANTVILATTVSIASNTASTLRAQNETISDLHEQIFRLRQEQLETETMLYDLDKRQAASLNSLQRLIFQQEEGREQERRYLLSQANFATAVYDAERGKMESARMHAVNGMLVMVSDRLVGCRVSQMTLVGIHQREWIPVLVDLLRDSQYPASPVEQPANAVPLLSVTPARFLPGC